MITTGQHEFNVWTLYLIFKIWNQLAKAQLFGEVEYKLNISY